MGLLGLDCEGRLTHWPDGYSFGLFRCVREGGTIDADYAPNVRTARAAGAIPGAYHYIGHGRPIRDDVKRLVDTIGDPTGLLVSPDVEDAGLTWAELETWSDEWQRHHPAHPVLPYTYRGFWSRYMPGRNGAALSPYLWAANPRIGSRPSDTDYRWRQGFGGWDDATIWQYKGTHSIGVGVSIDANAFRGTLAELRLLTRALPDTGTGGYMGAIVIDRLPFGPGTFTIPAGVDVEGLVIDVTSGTITGRIPWTPRDTPSSAAFDAYADLSGIGIRGNPFMRVTNGVFAGSFLSTAGIPPRDEGSAPPPDCSVQVEEATLPLRSTIQGLESRLETANGRLRQIRANVGTEDV